VANPSTSDVRLIVEGHAPFQVSAGNTLLAACEEHGVPMEAACGGFAACSTCRVDVLEGGENLSDRLPEEEAFLNAVGQRLACQAVVQGPVRIRLNPGL
jgi:adenylate cyclase